MTIAGTRGVALLLAVLAGADVASAADDAALAQKLSNPIASLISLPFQLNYDRGYGAGDGTRAYMNIQPVVPFSIGENWNRISRTILPVIWQHDVAGPSGDQSGFGDITQSLFLSPKEPGPGGIIWGAGPVLLVPVATDDALGGDTWGAGPTVVALRQSGPWTYGMLANHIWSFAGDADTSSTFVQPFVAYNTPTAWTFSLNSETTYDWKHEAAAVPVNAVVSKLVTLGNRPVSFAGGLRYWMESQDGGPDGFGVRLAATLLFPK